MEEYVIMQWPDSEILREMDWFDECVLINDDVSIQLFGIAAYFVPKKIYEELQIKS